MRIDYALPRTGHVRIDVYDVRGRRIARPLDERLDAGRHALVWNGEGTHGRVVAGVYFVRIEAEDGTATRRIVRLR